MNGKLEVSPEFEQEYRRLCSRNAGIKSAIDVKVSQILRNPLDHKPSHPPLQGDRRVDVGGSFALRFEPLPARQPGRRLRPTHHDAVHGI